MVRLIKKLFAFEKSVGAVLFRIEEKKPVYLILRYPHGHWDFPKGHVETGETEQQTASREIFEETGIKEIEFQKKFKRKMQYFYTAKGKEKKERIESGRSIRVFKKVVYFAAKTNQKEILISHEHLGYQWLGFGDALDRLTFKKAKEILTAANSAITADLKE